MPLATMEIDFLKQLIAKRSGNVISSNQDYLLESRLLPVAKSAGLANVNALVAELRKQTNGLLPERVAEAMTINETSFFRDLHPFEALRKTLLPEIRTKNAARKSLNIWSAACSTGQEIYSVAMHLREHFPELSSWKEQLVGTDLSD